MATVTESKPVRKITRKRAGYKRVVVELTDNHYEALSRLAVADIRRGGPTEMLSVLCRLNLDTLIKAHRPAQLALTDDKPYTINERYVVRAQLALTDDKPYTINEREVVRAQRQEKVDGSLPKSPIPTYSEKQDE